MQIPEPQSPELQQQWTSQISAISHASSFDERQVPVKTEVTRPGYTSQSTTPVHHQSEPYAQAEDVIQRDGHTEEFTSSNGTVIQPVRDYPDVPEDSMALVEKMMMNLRRASERGGSSP
jgi:hypothetical protein